MTRCDGHRLLWGGFEDEILLKASENPAALAAMTILTPYLPARATITASRLLCKFRELYCAADNYIATKGYVQLKKVTGGAWTNGLTIESGMLHVAAGVSGAGDVLVGDIDVSDQVENGVQLEFQFVTLRSHVDDLAIRDIQFGVQHLYTL